MNDIESFELMLIKAKIEYSKTSGIDSEKSTVLRPVWFVRVPGSIGHTAVFTFLQSSGSLLSVVVNDVACFG
jgi:hypothetical protein